MPRADLDVFLGVLEVVEERLLVPGDTGLEVGLGVRVAGRLAGLAADEAREVGALLVRAPRLDRVALRAFGLENLRALHSRHGDELWSGHQQRCASATSDTSFEQMQQIQ